MKSTKKGQKTTFRIELDALCGRHNLNGLKELSELSGIYYQTLRNRAKNPVGTKIQELISIADAVGATNQEIQALWEAAVGRDCKKF